MTVRDLDYRMSPRKPKDITEAQKRAEYETNAKCAEPQILTPHYKVS